MAVNVTITGNIFDNNSLLFSGSEVRYQPYFYNAAPGGSASKWGVTRTSIFGQYNFNLADTDLLGTDGEIANGDIVVVVFWIPNSVTDRLSSCSLIEQWGAFRIVLGAGPGMVSSATYVNNVQIKDNYFPNLIWTLPTDGLVGTPILADNSSNDTHQWNFGSVVMWQRDDYYSNLFTMNRVVYTSYDWDDGNQDNNLSGVADRSHTWSAAGDYTVQIVIEDECGGTVTGTKNIRIKYPPPVPNLLCHQADINNNILIPDTVVTFEYSGSNPNNRITSIDWVIADATSTSTNGLAVEAVVPHTGGLGTDWYNHPASPGAFTDPGVHNVAIVVHWHDGFDAQTTSYNEDFAQLKFSGPSVNFDQGPDRALVTSGVVFTNTSSGTNRVGTGFGPPNGVQYDWRWDDDGNVTQINNVSYSYQLTQTSTSDNCTVQLCAHWQDGWDEQITCIDKDVIFAVSIVLEKNDCYYDLTVYGTSDDGSVSGYHWDISRSTVSGAAGPPWEMIWQSPVATNQKYKTICFTEINFFKIEAFVHGNSTTASAQIEFFSNEVCAEECAMFLWNGTGYEDAGGDWDHSGHGIEKMYAKYEGTNGLDATGFTQNKNIKFISSAVVNVDQFDILSMFINLKQWQVNKDVQVFFDVGNKVNLSAYLDTTKLNEWQRVLIPFVDLGLVKPIDLNRLTLDSGGNIGFYLDNVMVTVGAVTTKVVAIEKPRMSAEAQDTPITRAQNVNYRPGMSAFPAPSNL
jgi:hypothetical protein